MRELGPRNHLGRPKGTENLVTNSDFESGVTGWTATRATVTQDTGAAKHGSASMSVASTADFAYARATLASVPDGVYTLSVFEKGGTPNANSGFVNVNDGTSEILQIGIFAGSASWTRRSGQFTVAGSPANVFLDLYSRFEGADGEVLWDAIQLEAGSAATPFTTGTRPAPKELAS